MRADADQSLDTSRDERADDSSHRAGAEDQPE